MWNEPTPELLNRIPCLYTTETSITDTKDQDHRGLSHETGMQADW